jgi:ribosomal protein L21E
MIAAGSAVRIDIKDPVEWNSLARERLQGKTGTVAEFRERCGVPQGPKYLVILDSPTKLRDGEGASETTGFWFEERELLVLP